MSTNGDGPSQPIGVVDPDQVDVVEWAEHLEVGEPVAFETPARALEAELLGFSAWDQYRGQPVVRPPDEIDSDGPPDLIALREDDVVDVDQDELVTDGGFDASELTPGRRDLLFAISALDGSTAPEYDDIERYLDTVSARIWLSELVSSGWVRKLQDPDGGRRRRYRLSYDGRAALVEWLIYRCEQLGVTPPDRLEAVPWPPGKASIRHLDLEDVVRAVDVADSMIEIQNELRIPREETRRLLNMLDLYDQVGTADSRLEIRQQAKAALAHVDDDFADVDDDPELVADGAGRYARTERLSDVTFRLECRKHGAEFYDRLGGELREEAERSDEIEAHCGFCGDEHVLGVIAP